MKFSQKYNKYVNKLKSIGGATGSSLPFIMIDGNRYDDVYPFDYDFGSQ